MRSSARVLSVALALCLPWGIEAQESPQAVATGGVTYVVVVDGAEVSQHTLQHTAQNAAVARFEECARSCEVEYRLDQTWRIEGEPPDSLPDPEPPVEPEPDPDPEPEPIEAPGVAGTPSFELTDDGVLVSWDTPTEGGPVESYAVSWAGGGREVVGVTTVVDELDGWLCVLTRGPGGEASEPGCNSYSPPGDPDPVPDPEPDPDPPPDGVWYEQDFQGFASGGDLCAWAHQCWGEPVTVETGTLFDGSIGRFVRAHYPGGGVGGTSGVDVMPPEHDRVKPRELWLEVYVRFAEDWAPEGDDKTLFVLQDWSDIGGPGEVNRWELHFRSAGTWFGGPYGRSVGRFDPGVGDPFDGEWHRLRWYIAMGSGPEVPDGAMAVWWDDALVFAADDLVTGNPVGAYLGNIALGRNADPFGSGIRDWGRLRVYVSDPGW